MFYKTLLIVLVLYGTCLCQDGVSKPTKADNPLNTSEVTNDGTTVVSTTSKPENISCPSYNGECKECVKHKVCYFCESSKLCNEYKAKELIPTSECSIDSIRYLTCSISFKILMILVGTLVAIVLLTIICVCCYCCCKKKGIKLSKDDIKFARQREERKARAEERKKERASRTDEIRRKYGLMKDDNPYERFDA